MIRIEAFYRFHTEEFVVNFWTRTIIALTTAALVLALNAPSAVAYDDSSPPQIGGQSQSLEGTSIGFVGGMMFSYDLEDPFLLGFDGRFTFDADPSFALSFNPALTYLFVSTPPEASFHLVQLDLNLLAKFNTGTQTTPYAGIGIPIFYFRLSEGGFDDSGTETFFNIFVGGLQHQIDDDTSIFGQVRMTRFSEGGHSETEASLMGGLNFAL